MFDTKTTIRVEVRDGELAFEEKLDLVDWYYSDEWLTGQTFRDGDTIAIPIHNIAHIKVIGNDKQ